MATGFSPMTYSATAGVQYKITVTNYGSSYFSGWSNGATSSSTTVTTTQSTTLTATYQTGGQAAQPILMVESEYQGGTPITGLYVTVESANGAVVADGFTPFTFPGTLDATYTVIASNYGPYNFIDWSTGSSDNYLTFSLSQSTTLAAYYS